MMDRGMTNHAEWLSPRKLQEYYVDRVLHDIQEAKKQLFFAVTKGEIRARCQGTILDHRWFEHLAVDDDDPHALPPDVELSVDDARQKWPGAPR
jgi:hypothetical protein